MILPRARSSKARRVMAGKCMKKAVLVLLGVLVTAGSLLVGCAQQPVQKDADAIKIALVYRNGMEYNASRYEKGMQMAIEEYTGPYQISVETYGEAEEFESSLETDNMLAENPDITAVVSLQDYEVIDAAAKTMNDYHKAFFAVQGYYDETAKKGYDSFFPFSLPAGHLGFAMGLYANEAGALKAGIIHSGTPFELEEANLFERGLMMGNARTVGSLSESFTQQEFVDEMQVWQALGVDVAYVPYYRSYWAADILAAIRNLFPDMKLLACFTLGSQQTVDYLGELEGTVVPAMYPVDRDEEYMAWAQRYEERYGETPENEAVQGYDLVNLIAANYDGSNETLSANLRANAENASGVAGNIVPDLLSGMSDIGYDDPYDYEYLVIQDGKFVHTEAGA